MEKWRQYQNENYVIVKVQIARPSSPHIRENIVLYNFLKLHYIRCEMTYVSSLTHVNYVTYYSFKSYFANTKLYLIIFYPHAVCLKTFLKEGNNQYAFKQYTTMMLQLYTWH